MKTITEWDHKAKKFKTYTITGSGTIIKPPGAPLGDMNTPLSVQRAARKIKQGRQKSLFGRKKP
jgi:hypothetical protein